MTPHGQEFGEGRSARAGLLALLLLVVAGAGTEPARAESESVTDVLARMLSPALRRIDRERLEVEHQLTRLPRPANGPTSDSNGYHSGIVETAEEARWVQVDLGEATPLDLIVLVPAYVSFGTASGSGYGFPVRFRVEVSDRDRFEDPVVLADYTAAPFPNPGDEPVFIPVTRRAVRWIRVTATELAPRGSFFTFALGELLAIQGHHNLAAGKPVTSLDSIETPRPWSRQNLVDFQSILGVPVLAEPSPSNGFHTREFDRDPEGEKWVEVDWGRPVPLTELRLVPARPLDWADRLGFGFPVRFRLDTSTGDEPWQTLADFTGTDYPNPGENLVVISGRGRMAERVRLTVTRQWERTRDFAFALGELQAWSGSTNVAFGATVSALESHEGNDWSCQALVDGFNSQNRLATLGEWLEGLQRRGACLQRRARLTTERQEVAEQVVRRVTHGALGGLAGVLLLAGLVLHQSRIVRQRELERTRVRLARDMHDELGSRLTEITYLSELARREAGNPSRAGELNERISARSREVVTALDELVWTVNPRNDSLPKLVGYLLLQAEKFFEPTPVRCRIDAPAELPDLPVTSDVRHHTLLMAKEALNNALKHAHATEVTLRVRVEDGRLEITIDDNGDGFTSLARTGNGLANLRERSGAIRGQCEIGPREGGGTRVRLMVPLRRARRTRTPPAKGEERSG